MSVRVLPVVELVSEYHYLVYSADATRAHQSILIAAMHMGIY